jgi:hypothetical protein
MCNGKLFCTICGRFANTDSEKLKKAKDFISETNAFDAVFELYGNLDAYNLISYYNRLNYNNHVDWYNGLRMSEKFDIFKSFQNEDSAILEYFNTYIKNIGA